MWIQILLKEIGIPCPSQARLWCDNLGAKYLASNMACATKAIEMSSMPKRLFGCRSNCKVEFNSGINTNSCLDGHDIQLGIHCSSLHLIGCLMVEDRRKVTAERRAVLGSAQS
jgi:hypothetical protein